MAQGMMPSAIGPGIVLGGRYRLESVLGRGGMGTVYVAVQEDLGRRVALKVLDPLLGADPAQVERFRRESQAAALAHHPNVVQITDFQWLPGEPPILVMELLAGESLARRIERVGPLSAGEAARIASQILSALEAAHAAGIVHRDLKPDNVHLGTVPAVGEIAKVLDFGIAKLMGHERVTATGALLGTPAYMAPEQVRGEAVDSRTDLYGVGAVLYHALTGALPHTADSASAMLYAILQKEPIPLATVRPDLPAGLVSVVGRALAKDPAHRFQSAAEMRAALAPFVASPTGAPVISSGALRSAPPLYAQDVHGPTMSAVPSAPPSPLAASSAGTAVGPHPPGPTPGAPWGPPAVSSVSGPPAPDPLVGSALGMATTPPKRAGGAGAAAALVMSLLVAAIAAGLAWMWFLTRDVDRGVTVSITSGSSSIVLSSHDRPPPPAPATAASPATATATAGTQAPPPPPATKPTAVSSGPTTPSGAPSNPSPPASASATASAAPAAAAKASHPMSGKRRNGGGGDFSECRCDYGALKKELDARMPAIDACLAASQYEAPEHEHNDYVLTFQDGKIVKVDRIAAEAPVPTLDACIAQVLTSIPPVPGAGGGTGTGRYSITSECDPGWSGQCAKMPAAAAR
jgi:serine/threonine-protein kinase